MKMFSSKFTMIAMATILFAGLAMATPTQGVAIANCGLPVLGSGQTNSATENCTISYNPTLLHIDSVSLTSFFDGIFDGKSSLLGAATVSSTMTLFNPGLVNVGPVVTNASGVQTNGPTICVSDGCKAAVAGPSFTVADSWVGNNAAVLGASFNKTIIVNYTYDPNPGVPEPASFAMIGGGLLALAAFARRRSA